MVIFWYLVSDFYMAKTNKNKCTLLQPFDQVIAIVLFWCLDSIYQDMAFFLIFERKNNSDKNVCYQNQATSQLTLNDTAKPFKHQH